VKELIQAIQQSLPAVAQEWNTVKLPLFETLVEKPFAEYFAGKQTQEKTKMMSPILDVIFARHVNQIIPEFVVDEGVGRDYVTEPRPWNVRSPLGRVTRGVAMATPKHLGISCFALTPTSKA